MSSSQAKSLIAKGASSHHKTGSGSGGAPTHTVTSNTNVTSHDEVDMISTIEKD